MVSYDLSYDYLWKFLLQVIERGRSNPANNTRSQSIQSKLTNHRLHHMKVVGGVAHNGGDFFSNLEYLMSSHFVKMGTGKWISKITDMNFISIKKQEMEIW